MKNIFIGGVAKSGKSRLAEYLHDKKGYNHIPLDYFTSSFKHNFTDLGITSNVVIDKKSSELFSLFLSRIIKGIETNNSEIFILDSAHIMPSDIAKYLDRDKWDVYYLGFKNISAEDKLKELEVFNKLGWTTKRTHEENLDIFKQLIELSKEIEKECIDNNITYIDTSNKDILDIYKEN